MRRQVLHSVCALVVLVGGCPRHSATRLTYVPAPPPPSTKAAAQNTAGDTMVIEEPPPPAPPEQPSAAPANPAPVEATTPRRRAPAPVQEKPAEAPRVPAPTLEPLAEAQKQRSVRSEVVTLQTALAKRIKNADALDLKPSDRHAFEDARGFLAQSLRALEDGDADRAKKLAIKASLLLDAVDQGR